MCAVRAHRFMPEIIHSYTHTRARTHKRTLINVNRSAERTHKLCTISGIPQHVQRFANLWYTRGDRRAGGAGRWAGNAKHWIIADLTNAMRQCAPARNVDQAPSEPKWIVEWASALIKGHIRGAQNKNKNGLILRSVQTALPVAAEIVRISVQIWPMAYFWC